MQQLNKKALQKQADDIYKETRLRHFSKQEVEGLLVIFHEHISESSPRKALDRSKFREVLHNIFEMTEDILMDRIFRAFDQDSDSYVSDKEWVMGLAVFLRGSLDEKIKYAFEVYDLNGDGYISREEMFQMLKTCLVKQPTEEDPDEGVKDLVELTLKKMDHDHDTRLSYTDFEQSVKIEPLLLESFGSCLPDEKVIASFDRKIRGACNSNM